MVEERSRARLENSLTADLSVIYLVLVARMRPLALEFSKRSDLFVGVVCTLPHWVSNQSSIIVSL